MVQGLQSVLTGQDNGEEQLASLQIVGLQALPGVQKERGCNPLEQIATGAEGLERSPLFRRARIVKL